MTTATRKGVGRQEKSPHVDYTDALGHINTAPHTRQKAGSVYRQHYESRPDPALVAAQAHIDETPFAQREYPDFYNRSGCYAPERQQLDNNALAFPDAVARAWFVVTAVASALAVTGMIAYFASRGFQ